MAEASLALMAIQESKSKRFGPTNAAVVGVIDILSANLLVIGKKTDATTHAY